ncbi:MAG TPA: rhodanese-like domain-containing protein [Candidatus Nanopelagicaceae bacterium]|jgi:rhodanese-related sulfurtransferase
MNKRVVAGIGVLIAGALLLAGCSSNKGAITNMNAKDFSNITQQSNVVILDVRTPGEFSQGHIQGAMNIDVEASTFDSEIAKLDKSKTYAVYCHSGRRSGIATEAMAKMGFKHIYNLQNGLADWMSQGMMTVTS